MGCGSCSTKGGGCAPTGCGSKGSCGSGGCNRLNVFDWLSDMTAPGTDDFDIVEIRFKGGRKEFYRNRNRLHLTTGDPVIIDAAGGGWHLGHVSLKGELVRLQMRKKKVEPGLEIRAIQRIATDADLEKWHAAREQEATVLYRARMVVDEMRIQMKVSDVEYQADRSRATFYYSSEDRVDFRDLVRILADEFRLRVEMRQISLRQEAGRIGGIGSCGRELCCSTWLTDFKTVSTTAARYQQLSLNPAKLAGQCGRLKCCLNYELDTYLDALKDIPTVNRPLLTAKGDAFLQKTDIFRRLMWFGFKGENEWQCLPVARVREIQEMNKRGEKPEVLLNAPEPSAIPEPEVAQVEGLLERLDDKFTVSAKKKKRKKKDKDKKSKDGAMALLPGDQPKKEKKDKKDKKPKLPKEDRPKDGRPKEERSREDRPREARPKEDRPRDARPREDRPRDERPREDRPRDERPREDRPRDARPREDRPRDDRPRPNAGPKPPRPEPAPRPEGMSANPEAEGGGGREGGNRRRRGGRNRGDREGGPRGEGGRPNPNPTPNSPA